MNPEYFQQSNAGHVRKIGQGATGYWAFIPNPLPPSIAFDIPLIQVLSNADRALGELAGLGRTLTNPNLLVMLFIRLEAVLSSRIEGTQADITHLYAYDVGQLSLPGFTPPVPEEDIREVRNYVHALEYGIQRLNTLPVSLRFVRELHEKLMTGVRGDKATPGEFRRTKNWIGRPGCTLNDADFVPPPLSQMHECLDAWEKYIHSSDPLPPLLKLALIHYQFEAIHPFIDGNGRIGRLLISLLLIHWQLLPLPLLYLSVYFERNRSAYYGALMAVSQHGTWYDWLFFFLSGLVEQALDTSNRAKQLQDLQLTWQQSLLHKRVSSMMFGIINRLFEYPVLSTNDIQKQFNVSHPTAIKALRQLEEMKILREVTGKQRHQLYVSELILNILTQ